MADSSHIKSTFKHALIYASEGMLGKAVGFIMLPFYAHYLRGEGYGVIGMIDVVLSVLTVLIGYGISNALNRFYFESDDPDRRKLIVSTTIILMFFLTLIVTTPVLIFYKQVAYLAFGRSDWGHYIILALLAFMAEITAKNAQSYILIRQQSIYLSVISLGKLILALSLNIYFIVYLNLGVLGYLYSSLATGVMFTIFMHFIVLRQVGFGFERTIAREVLKFYLPMLPGYISMFIRGNANRVIIRTFLGLQQVGTFEMLFKFATLIGFLIVEPFGKIWGVKRFEICELEDGPPTMARIYTYQLSIMLFATLILSLEIPIILKLLTPEEFWLTGFIVFFAVLSRVLLASYHHMSFGLWYAKKTFMISKVQMSTAAVSVLSALVLTKYFGLLGAVLASVISTLFQCLMGFWVSRKHYGIPFEWWKITRLAAMTVGLFWLGKDFSLTGTKFLSWLEFYMVPFIEKTGPYLYLDKFKDGKILLYLTNKFPLFVDGAGLLLYSFIFVFGLFAMNILPRTLLKAFFSLETLRRPSRLFSWSQ